MAWKEAQKPMQVKSENDLWVRISPKMCMFHHSQPMDRNYMLLFLYKQ